MRTPPPRRFPSSSRIFLVTALLGTSGCSYFRTLGSGTHLDSARPVHETDRSVKTMIVEVTTDAQGQIANIRFTRSSGRDGIDGYVAESIRQGWPGQPATRTVVEVTFSGEKGFSQPKVLSTGPATPPAPGRG